MTKAIKKGLLAILLFGLLVASAFSALSFRTAFAATEAENFVSNANAFVALADQGTDQEEPDGVLTAEEIKAVMGSTVADANGKTADNYFLQMYNFINNESGSAAAQGYAEAKAIYTNILAVYNETVYTDAETEQEYGAVDLYSNLFTTVRAIYKKTGHSYSLDRDGAKIYRAIFNTIDANKGDVMANQYNFLKNSDLEWVDTDEDEIKDTPEILVEAENKIQEWADNIANAITAIKAIRIYIEAEAANVTIVVWNESESEYRDVYKKVTEVIDNEEEVEITINNVVLQSRATIEAARTAVDKVIAQGDVDCINGTYQFDGTDTNHLKVLTDAETGLKEQIAKITAVEKEITNVFAKFSKEAGKEVCYTIKKEIETANANFNALSGADYNKDETIDYLNDLQGNVNPDIRTNLIVMLDTLADVETKITEVNNKITEIGVVSYNRASKTLIAAARTAFDALPNDVKVNDNGLIADKKTTGYCVSGYTTLVAAENKWAKYVEEVENLIASIKALRNIEVTAPLTIYNEANAVQSAYNALSDKENQLAGDYTVADDVILGVRPTKLDENFKPTSYIEEITTCGDAYDYYIDLINAITTSVKQVKVDITAWNTLYSGEARLTVDFNNYYNKINSAIADLPKVEGELDPRYKGAIDNFDVYEKLKTAYEAELEKAVAWADKVAEIGKVSVNTFDKVEAAVAAFAEIAAIYPEGVDVDNDNAVIAPADLLASDLAVFNVAKAEAESEATTLYSTIYATYKAAVDKKAEIITKLNAVKAAADALVRPGLVGVDTILEYDEEAEEDIERKVNEEDYTKYATAVSAVTALVNGLATYDDTTVEGYITTAKYFETYAGTEDATVDGYVYSFAKYEKALDYVKADEVELAINKITANATEDVNYIAQARTAYDALEDEDVQKEVRNFTDILKAEEDKLNDWKDKVNALLKEAAFDGSDVAANKVGAISDITTDEQLKAGIYKLNVVDTKKLIDAYANFTAVEKAYTDVALTKDLADKLYAIAGGTNAEQGTKLAYIDKELSEYVIAYNNGSPAAERYDQLVEILDNLDVTQKALLTNASDFEQIARDNEMALELAKAIVNLYADVQVQVDAKTVVEYNIISSIYKNLNGSQKVLVDANVATLNSEASLDKIGETIGNGGAPANIDDAIANAIADAKTELTNAIDTAKAEAIADAAAKDDVLKTAYEAADTALEAAIKTAYEAADAALKTAYEEAIAAAKTELASAIAAAKAEAIADAAAKDAALQSSITTAYEAAITAAKAELTETYNAEIASLRRDIAAINAAIDNHTEDANKIVDELNAKLAAAQSTATAALIVAIVGVLAAGAAIVIIFVLRKRG